MTETDGTITVQGLMIVDPRDNQLKHTQNPALILMHIVKNYAASYTCHPGEEQKMWKGLADFCDEQGYQLNILF